MGRIRLISLSAFFVLSISSGLFGFKTRIIEKKHVACFVYSKSSSFPSKTAEFILRDAISEFLSKSDNMVLVSKNKVSSYFNDAQISKKNFANLMKENPLTNFFITARVYYNARHVNLHHNVLVRVSVYSTSDKVKRIKRFFIKLPFYKWKETAYSVAKKSAEIIGEHISDDTIVDKTSVYLNLAEANYNLKITKNHSKALDLFLKALDEANHRAYYTADKASSLLINLSKPLAKLKKAGENKTNIELLASLYYYKKKDYKKAENYLKSYLKKNKEFITKSLLSENINNAKIANGLVLIKTDKHIKLLRSSDLKLLHKKNSADKNIETGIISPSLIYIGNKIIPLENQDELTLVKKEHSKLYLKTQNSTCTLILKTKSKRIAFILKTHKVMLKTYDKLSFVITANNIFCFDLDAGKLLYQRTTDTQIEKTIIKKAYVFILTVKKAVIINKLTGKLYRKLDRENALEAGLENSVFAKSFKHRISAVNINTGRKWEKKFENFAIYKLLLGKYKIICYLRGSGGISYKIDLSYKGIITGKKIIFDTLLASDEKTGIFVYKNKIESRCPFNRSVNKALFFKIEIQKKLSGVKYYYNLLFSRLITNPCDLRALKALCKITKSKNFNILKSSFIKSFRNTFNSLELEIPKGDGSIYFILSYIKYPFVKSGYSSYLKFKKLTDINAVSIFAPKGLKLDIRGELLIAVKNSSFIEVLNLKTKKTLWRMKNFSLVNNSLKDRLLLLSKKDKLLICVKIKNGTLIWSSIIKKRSLIVKTNKTRIFSIGTDNEERTLIKTDLQNGKTKSIKIGKSRIYFGNNIFYLSDKNKVSAYNSNTLKLIWKISTLTSYPEDIVSTFKSVFLVMKNKAVELRKSDGMTKHVYTFNSKISSYFTDKNSLCISLIRNKGTGSLILKLADNKVSALYKAGYPADMIFTLKSKLCIISKNKIHIIDLKTGKDLFSFENNFTFIKRGKYFLYTVYKSFGFALNKYVLKSCVYKLLSLKRNSFILKGGIIIK